MGQGRITTKDNKNQLLSTVPNSYHYPHHNNHQNTSNQFSNKQNTSNQFSNKQNTPNQSFNIQNTSNPPTNKTKSKSIKQKIHVIRGTATPSLNQVCFFLAFLMFDSQIWRTTTHFPLPSPIVFQQVFHWSSLFFFLPMIMFLTYIIKISG